MKKIMMLLIFTLVMIFPNFSLISQNIIKFTSIWNKTFSVNYGCFGRAIVDNNDVVIGGATWPSWPSGTTDQMITKINPNGNIIFQTIRAPGDDHDGFQAVVKLQNGNYGFYGAQNAQGTQYSDGFYNEFNNLGNEVSYNFFSIPGSTNGSDMIILSNGNRIYTGNHIDGKNYVALTDINFNKLNYQTFDVGGWSSAQLGFDTINNFVYAIGSSENSSAIQIVKYDLSLNFIANYTIINQETFLNHDIKMDGTDLLLCGFKVIGGVRYGSFYRMSSNGIIKDSLIAQNNSEFTAIESYDKQVILAKSNLLGSNSILNELIVYSKGEIVDASINLNSSSPFVPFDLVMNKDTIYVIGAQGQNHWIGIPAVEKLLIGLTPPPCELPKEGLVGYWPFCGNADDKSGNENHGTVNGATLTEDRFGRPNQAYSFDNTNISIENKFYDNSMESYTISLWFNINDTNKLSQVFFNTIPHDGEGSGYNMGYSISKIGHGKNSNLEKHAWDIINPVNNQLNYFPVYQNNWYNLTIKKQASIYYYFINGKVFDTLIVNLKAVKQFTGLIFGTSNIVNEYMVGKLDDFAIWDRALSEKEIVDLYTMECTDCELTPPPPPCELPKDGLVGYWPFCGNADDKSGNENHGTVNGASLTEDRFGRPNQAFYYDGIDDDINLHELKSLGKLPINGTFSCWFKLSSLPNPNIDIGYTLFSRRHKSGENVGWYTPTIDNNTQNGLIFKKDYEWHTSAPLSNYNLLSINEWYYATFVVKNKDTLQLFVNGQFVEEVYDDFDLKEGSDMDFIIGYHGAWNSRFHGVVDDLAIWTRVLTAEEIQQVYKMECDVCEITNIENEVAVNSDILIFPNPSSEKISLDLGGVAVADLVVYDILGNEIMSIPNYNNKSEIDISNLSIGTYTIQVQTSTGSISQRLLVNR